MAKPICKYAHLVESEIDLETALPRAFTEATTGRPGPTWLDIPLDIQQSTVQINIPTPQNPVIIDKNALKVSCKKIISKLCNSHRPVILAGTGVRLSDTQDRLLNLIECLEIPLTTAWTHDLIASDHPLFAGRPGTIGTRSGNFCLQNADFVLVLGSRLNIRQTSYNWDTFAKHGWVAHVDIDAAELNKPTIKVDLGVKANLCDFFDTIEEEIKSVKFPSFWPWVDWCQKISKKYHIAKEHSQKSDSPLNPYVMVDRIFKQMRADDIVVTGNASACILPFQIGTLQAKQRIFSNSGSASMGYDLPAALGAAVAAKGNGNRRVICFAGDGSIQMNIQELQTLKTSGLNVIIIVLNNSGYLSIWQTHENFFGRVIGATPESGVEFPNFDSIAQSYGIKAVSISAEADLVKLDLLMQQDGPILIDLHVDPRQEFAPRIKSRVDENGKFVTPELDDMHPFLNELERDTIRSEAQSVKAIL